ncbi:MAG: PEP-CTERM sorting domain-containing protein [Gammaproteobacteria bacterium]
MLKYFKPLVVGGLLILSGAAQAIMLTGDTVTVELWSSASGSFGIQNVVVGGGTDGTYFGNQNFDLNFGIDEDRFIISSTSNFSSIDGPGGTIEWRLSGLDFVGGALLTAVNLIQLYSDVTVSSLTPNSVTFSYSDIAIPAGKYFEAQFVGVAGAVPEPAMLGLVSLALAAGWRNRRDRSRTS